MEFVETVEIYASIQRIKTTKKYNMALIKKVRGFSPEFGDNCWFAENATIIGDVIMGTDCTVWYNAVLRGDVNSIRIGNKVNIQDGSVLHTLYEKHKYILATM